MAIRNARKARFLTLLTIRGFLRDMAKLVPLFSSSRGNSYYVSGNASAILVDAGRNCKQIELALASNGLSMERVGAVFVTHEHTDHVSALKVLLKKYRLPVIATAGTLEQLIAGDKLPAGIACTVIEDEIDVGGFMVRRVQTSHDAAESCGFHITTPDGRRCAIVTDTGYLTDDARHAIGQSDLAVVESNHDIGMLRSGPYPYALQQRILSDIGHLSNRSCAEALPAFVNGGVTRIILAHLSGENNSADTALSEAMRSLSAAGMTADRDYIIDVAPPASIGKGMVF